MVDTILGLTDDQLADYEARAEQAMLAALESVMNTIARHLGATHTASALVAHLPGKHDQSTHGRGGGGGGAPMTGEQFDARMETAAWSSEALSDTAIDPDDREIRDALRDYGGGGSYAANGKLREVGGDKSSITDWRAREVADGMDRAFEGHTLSGDAVVMRGISNPAVTFGGRDPVPGMEWVDHGYVSTSASLSASAMFTGAQYDIRGGVSMRILAPAGTPAISSHLLPFDNEIVLGRGLTYRVVRDNGADFDGVRHLDVEVVP